VILSAERQVLRLALYQAMRVLSARQRSSAQISQPISDWRDGVKAMPTSKWRNMSIQADRDIVANNHIFISREGYVIAILWAMCGNFFWVAK